MICKVCLGVSKIKCLVCGAHRVVKSKLKPQELAKQERNEERVKFLRHTWDLLKKFRTVTTGSADLDAKLRTMFGEWIS